MTLDDADADADVNADADDYDEDSAHDVDATAATSLVSSVTGKLIVPRIMHQHLHW